jgi:DNA-binding transcriptional LysR family regulator
VSHPTLSRRLRQIEQQVGARLFDRTPTAFRLTPAGEEMRQVAVRLRDEIDALERRIVGRDRQPSGPVRLTAPDAVAEYLLPGILADLCHRTPGLVVDLVVSNQVLSLAQRSADIAIRMTDSPDPDPREFSSLRETAKGQRRQKDRDSNEELFIQLLAAAA